MRALREIWLRAASPKGYRSRALDAPQVQLPPSAPASAQLAAIDFGPVSKEQAELCKKASRVDWPYLGAMVLADVGTVILDSQGFQTTPHAGERLVGPGLVGLSWGWTVGGFYLTLPQCSPDFVNTRPPEGTTRSAFPLALSFSILAAVTAPVIVGVETGEGAQTLQWAPSERVMRLVIAGATGAVGSVMPYVLPPRTWRALRELRHVQAGADAHGAMIGYSVPF